MGGYPDLVFIIDTHKESLAIAEAKKLNIPIMAILDSNCNPDGITFPIPGNDDSAKSIKLYCRLISDAAIAGIKENMAISGVDISKFEGDELPANIRELKNSTAEKKDHSRKDHTKDFKKKEIVKKTEEKEEKSEVKKPAAAKTDASKKPAGKKPVGKK